MNMQYNINEQNIGISRTLKTIVLYSSIIIFFGLLLGALYFWVSTSLKVEEILPVNKERTEDEKLEMLADDLQSTNENLQFASDAELWEYIESEVPGTLGTSTESEVVEGESEDLQ